MMIASPQVRQMFLVLSGEQWPTADEQALWELAQQYRRVAGLLSGELAPLVVGVVAQIESSFVGKGQRRFAERMADYASAGLRALPSTAQALVELADALEHASLQVQYLKLVSIMEIALL